MSSQAHQEGSASEMLMAIMVLQLGVKGAAGVALVALAHGAQAGHEIHRAVDQVVLQLAGIVLLSVRSPVGMVQGDARHSVADGHGAPIRHLLPKRVLAWASTLPGPLHSSSV